MRRYAVLKEPFFVNDSNYIYKIMLYQDNSSVSLFKYCSMDAILCTYDDWYENVESVYEDWNEYINDNGWIDIDDPLADCQHDGFLTIRVKGRDIGNPQWGSYELFENGQWKEYKK